MTLITGQMVKVERLRSMARVFTQADQILTGQDVSVAVVEEAGIPAPGYSNGADICINLPYVGNVDTTEDIIKINGLNFHELSHVMFSPRAHTSMIKTVKKDGLFDAWNMLEDQRIETFLTSMYKSTEPYFTKMIMDYLLGNETQWDTAYALLYGRKYLPKHILEALRERYTSQDHVDRIEEIIDEYRVLVFPRDYAHGIDLIREYNDLIRENGWDKAPQDPFGHSSGKRPEITQGEPMDGEEQQDAAEWTDYRDSEREEDEEAEAGEGSGEGEDGDEGDGSGSGQSDKDGEDGRGCDGEQGSKGKGDSDDDESKSGPGAGTGKGDPSPQKHVEDLKRAMKKAADEAVNLPEVQADAKAKEKAIQSEQGQIPSLSPRDYDMEPVSPAYMLASNGFKRELSKLWIDSDPGWHRYQSSGRINIDRVMQGADLDESWDRWDEGKTDATSIELVTLFDISSSMDGVMDASSQALWAVKRAVESIGGNVTVIGFNYNAYTMYDKKQKAERATYRYFGASGGTAIGEACTQARMILHYSKMKHKIALFITDGDWSDAGVGNTAIRDMKQHGVLTALGFIDTGYAGFNAHGCDVSETLDGPEGLIPLAKKITTHAMQARI
jgi:hypothetical protein